MKKSACAYDLYLWKNWSKKVYVSFAVCASPEHQHTDKNSEGGFSMKEQSGNGDSATRFEFKLKLHLRLNSF